MRKIIIVAGVLIFILGAISPSFAVLRKDRDYYIGEILSVDTSSNMIKIMDLNSRTERTVKIEKGLRKEHKAGADVWLSVQRGTSVAKAIKIVEPRKKLINPNKMDYFIGKILSVDKEGRKITMFDYNSNIERTFALEKDLRADLVADTEIVVHAEKGTKNAKSARIIIADPLE